MLRFIKFAVVGAIVAVCGWFFQRFDIRGLDHVSINPKGKATSGAPATPGSPTEMAVANVPSDPNRSLKIASYNIQVFGASKEAKPQVMQVLCDVVRRFDIVAIQEVRAKSDDILPRFIEQINSTGRHYDFVIGPRLGRTASKEQYAFIYDRDTVEVDRATVYTVSDPDDLLHREPLVAWFRVRGPSPEEAFTFTLVDIHTDPDEVASEVNALAGVFRAVRDDGHGEDDVILLGDLNADNKHLGDLGRLPSINCAIANVPSNTRRDKLYDNIIFNRQATVEYTGRSGVLDVMNEYHLTLPQALEVSDHFPVWAEFSLYEGRQPGRLAAKPAGAAN